MGPLVTSLPLQYFSCFFRCGIRCACDSLLIGDSTSSVVAGAAAVSANVAAGAVDAVATVFRIAVAAILLGILLLLSGFFMLWETILFSNLHVWVKY